MGLSDWRMIVALLSSFFAKENTIATLGVLFGAPEGDRVAGDAGRRGARARARLAFLAAAMLFIPCLATVATIKQETGSWKWTAASIGLLLAISVGAGIVLYQGLRIVGVGDERRAEPADAATIAVVSRRHSLDGGIGEAAGVGEGVVDDDGRGLAAPRLPAGDERRGVRSGCAGCAVVSPCKLPGASDRLPLLALTEKGRVAARTASRGRRTTVTRWNECFPHL